MITRRLLIGAASALAMLGSVPAIAAPPIKIGVQAPITGPYADEGQGIERAVKLLAEEQNAKGGLLGRRSKSPPATTRAKPRRPRSAPASSPTTT